MHSVAKKVAKRKIDPTTHSKETKVKKVDAIMKVKKSSSKAELIVQLEELIQKYDVLEKEHHKNIDVIARIKSGKSESHLESQKDSKGTQTENSDVKCIECTFASVSKDDVRWHMHETHGWTNIKYTGSKEDSDFIEREPGLICKECHYQAEDMYDYDGHVWSEICTDPTVQTLNEKDKNLSCEVCEEKFNKLKELMRHKKAQHGEKVQLCWNNASGTCDFGDKECWFVHGEKNPTIFKCSSCDKTFAARANLLHHRKQHHVELVQSCRQYRLGTCKYASDKCWFRHSDTTESITNKNEENVNEGEKSEQIIKYNQEVIEKLFNMMEKMTERIVQMENII